MAGRAARQVRHRRRARAAVTAARLDRGLLLERVALRATTRYVVVSTDFIKSDAPPRRVRRALPRARDRRRGPHAPSPTPASAAARHQRYELLRRLAADPSRHLHPRHRDAALRQGGALPQPRRLARPDARRLPADLSGRRASRTAQLLAQPLRPAPPRRHPRLPRRGHPFPTARRRGAPTSSPPSTAPCSTACSPTPARRSPTPTAEPRPPAGALVVGARAAARPRLVARPRPRTTLRTRSDARDASTTAEEADELGRAARARHRPTTKRPKASRRRRPAPTPHDDDDAERPQRSPPAARRSPQRGRRSCAGRRTTPSSSGATDAGARTARRRLQPDRVLPLHPHRRVRRRTPRRRARRPASRSRP